MTRGGLARADVARSLGFTGAVSDEILWPAVAKALDDRVEFAVWSTIDARPDGLFGRRDPFSFGLSDVLSTYHVRARWREFEVSGRILDGQIQRLDPTRDRHGEFRSGLIPPDVESGSTIR